MNQFQLSKKKGSIYLQINEILKDRIIDGTYPLESYIPTEIQLEEEFNVSKITIRNAVRQLAEDGYVEKKSGKGTKVINNNPISKLSKGQNFTEILIKEGSRIHKEFISVEECVLSKDSFLFNHYGERCYKISRIYYLDGEPYIHYTHYLSAILPIQSTADFYSGSLYQLLSRNGIEFAHFQDDFSVQQPSFEICQQLEIEPTFLLKRMRYSYDIDGNLVEYSEGFYNTQLREYTVRFDV
ncbi:GntR family transcriptional regulator [Ferdinandcohnia quinoae]|uniref:GntR family transcriptional regulator n=1 Tax=Fredinandcohnia quinoae TaxID=2918902 RepID=A0AAW5E444_9BACI|nr:GntR family transcriptional regulator [Fredinandcohnia sp. SECRCQ15]MCH1624340.1 GntR family transcriptional regulator [Fredinandcohnia sp. SECRCQ15]